MKKTLAMYRVQLLSTLLLCAALPAMAQQVSPVYDSAFTGYKAYQEPTVADWKLTNGTVAAADAKGADPHAGHDMSKMNHGAHAVPKAAPAKAAPPKPKAPDPHAGHHNH